jgi:hypothetical protein
LIVAAVFLVFPAFPANAEHRDGPCDLHQREDESVRALSKRLIRCAADRWDIPGGAQRAICVADHESHLNPEAVSSGGTYVGLFQHLADAWPDRYEAWTRRAWHLDESPLSGRSNAIVTVRMINADGWGPWSGVDGCGNVDAGARGRRR